MLPVVENIRVTTTETYRLYISKHLIALMCRTDAVHWSASKFVEFISDVNEKVNLEDKKEHLLQDIVNDLSGECFPGGWDNLIKPALAKHMLNYLKEKKGEKAKLMGHRAEAFLRQFRNSAAHFFEFMLNSEIRILYSSKPEELLDYWGSFRPDFVFRVYQKVYGKEDFKDNKDKNRGTDGRLDGSLGSDMYFGPKYYPNQDLNDAMMGLVVSLTKPEQAEVERQ